MLLNKYFSSIENEEKTKEEKSKQDDCQLTINGEEENDNLIVDYEELGENLDHELHMELVQLKMEHLKLQEAQLKCKQRMLLLNSCVAKKQAPLSGSNRCILPDGRIIVRNVNDRASEELDKENYADGDANSGHNRSNGSWEGSDSGSDQRSSSCTCKDRGETHCRVAVSRSPTRESNKEKRIKPKDSQTTTTTAYELAFSDFASNIDDDDEETDRLIRSRANDYRAEIEDCLKLVIAPDGYPKLKLQLRQMEMFQRAIDGLVVMQLKAGLLKKAPTFHDYYLNRGAIVCVCKDSETRDWVVEAFAGFEERMGGALMLLTTKVKRIYLGTLRIPKGTWPATPREVFKLLQYFNPELKTDTWRIYSQKKVNNVKCTSFLVDRISAEIIRGSKFKNVIDYSSMEFELTGHAEIYYESACTELREDLSSVASGEMRSKLPSEDIPQDSDAVNKALEVSDRIVIKELEEVEHVDQLNDQSVWVCDEIRKPHDGDEKTDDSLTPDRANSAMDSLDSNATADSRRGIVYHRCTNYLHVDNELKLALTLDDYPQSKLGGKDLKRLKTLYQEQLNKDVKAGRFQDNMLPRFYDVFLSNGAVVYVCDNYETRDYLTEILPIFIRSTDLKLVFKEIDQLLRYTKVLMRLPKELAYLGSMNILKKLQAEYPALKLDCWKCYSDVAGRQSRHFGVDPESLKVIRSPGFEFSYEGKTIEFRVVGRMKPDERINEKENKPSLAEEQEQWERISKEMYLSISDDTTITSLSRIRANHYSDFVADNLKLYLGPTDNPETKLDEAVLFKIKDVLKHIVLESVRSGQEVIPKIHDLYLFDGVIFAICRDSITKCWVEEHVPMIGTKLGLNLRSLEYRGAVGIVSMSVRTNLKIDEVIATLRKQNPRLRTKFWRTISVDHSQGKLEATLQIDKLSAQVITDPAFEPLIGDHPVQFNLGHLQSLIRTETALECVEGINVSGVAESPKKIFACIEGRDSSQKGESPKTALACIEGSDASRKGVSPKTALTCMEGRDASPGGESSKTALTHIESRDASQEGESENIVQVPQRESKMRNYENEMNGLPHEMTEEVDEIPEDTSDYCPMTLEVPKGILPDNEDDFNVILDLLEDKNPGLDTELWMFACDDVYSSGIFNLLVDPQSASVIKGDGFDSNIGGEQLKFIF